ncbi:MAG: S8 family serine peptidase [Saprospiraceae bacterium]
MVRSFFSVCLFLFLVVTNLFSQDKSKIDPKLLLLPEDSLESFVIVLKEQAVLSGLKQKMTKNQKAKYVYETLLKVAESSQQELIKDLNSNNIPYQSFYIVNCIEAKGNIQLIRRLAQRDDVAQIIENGYFQMLKGVRDDSQDTGDRTPIWNLTKIGAPNVWNKGFTGQNVVVGGQDTGYGWSVAAIKSNYRGWNGTTASHDYNWHDAIHMNDPSNTGTNPCGYNLSFPCDDNGHGTHTMGTIVGSVNNSNNDIGVAPGAKWIACRNMERGDGTLTTYIECFEWFLAPYPYNGTPSNGDSDMMPHVINNSWGCPISEGCNSSNFATMEAALNNLRSAGCVIVVSAGNDGPNCNTVSNPAAIFEGSFSVGATNSSDAIASFSSRGAVTVDNSNRLKPNISAPGVSINSCYPDGTFGSISGTSMAGPHVAGAVALVISANSELAGKVDKIEEILEQTAIHYTSSTTCSNVSGTPNNIFGYGRLDVEAAVDISNLSAYLPYVSINGDLSIFAISGGLIFTTRTNEKYRVTVGNTGNLSISSFTITNNTHDVMNSSIYIQNPGKGIVLKSPNGTLYRLNIGANGELQTTSIASYPTQAAMSMSQDIHIDNSNHGLILKDAADNCYLVNITTLGNLISIPTNCP